MHRAPSTASGLRRYRGSDLLASCLQRLLRVLPVVLGLWAMTGWAMDWW
ncbi:hypothetical protein H0A65_03570 [Alcaligenaceae bacterium]|nr:hypothetical protein [Alcaligenaceae bacterium]